MKKAQIIRKNKIDCRAQILQYYAQHQNITAEEKEVIEYLQNNPLEFFPYSFTEEYKHKDIDVYFDNDCRLYYVLHDQKRLYFKRNLSPKNVKNAYRSLLLEQDYRSPHCYVTSSFKVSDGDVLADIGAAEGILGLMMIDKVKHLYIFEPQQEWIEALEQTFASYKEKVTIVNKFVSDENNDTQISLDYYFEHQQYQPNFLKLSRV